MLTARHDLRGGVPVWAGSPRQSVPAQEALHTDHCDVAIVGGGISGALIALALAQAGQNVVVLDRRAPGHGSTMASTAMIQFEIDTPLTHLADRIGAKKAERAYLRSARAVASLRQLIKTHGLKAEWEDRDALYLSGPGMGHRALRTEAGYRARIGLPSQFLPGRELKERFGIDRTGAILSGGSGEVNPIQLSTGCLRAAQILGARIHHYQEVVAVGAASRSVTLTTRTGGEIVARRVIFATGYEVVDGLPRGQFDIRSTWAIATQPLPPEDFWPGRCLIWEAADPYLYFRATADNRIVAGGEDSGLQDAGRRDRAIAGKSEKILAALNTVLPGRDLQIDYAWAGAFADSPTGLPLFEPVEGLPNCLAVLGCGGNGITFSMVAAEIARSWVQGRRDPDRDLFRSG